MWVNSHQLFPLGLVLVAAFLIGGATAKWTGERARGDWRLVAVALGMGVACLLNPYGYKLLWAPLPAYSQVQDNPYFIQELVPPFSSVFPSASSYLFWYQVLIVVSALPLLLSLTLQVGRLASGGTGGWEAEKIFPSVHRFSAPRLLRSS